MVKRWVAASMAMLALSACALTEDVVKLEYRPSNAPALDGAAGIPLQVAVSDHRAGNRDRVSVKKNGYGMEMAGIRSDQPITDLIRTAIEQELRSRGFAIDKGALVDVQITRLWNDFKNGFLSGDAVADVAFTVKVSSASGAVVFSRSIVAQGQENNIQLAGGDNAKLALDRGIQSAIGMLLADREFLAALLGSAKLATRSSPTS